MISVVIPLYNKEAHIAEALESVLAQTVLPAEIIVVDDGSTDQGAFVVEEFLNRGVKLVKQENQGVSAARNKGLQEATSEYVAFLDADDRWLPGHLELLLKLADTFPGAGLLSTSLIVERGRKLLCNDSIYPKEWIGVVEDFFYTYARDRLLVHSSSVAVARSSFINAGAFPVGVKRGEDVIAWVRTALLHPVAHAQNRTVIYNQDAFNRTESLRESDAPESLKYLAELLGSNNLASVNRQSIALLFDVIAINTAAGFLINSDKSGSKNIRRLAWINRRFKVVLLISVLSYFSPDILLIMRRLKSKKC